MSPDEIKTDHCYWMTPIKGRRTVARVTKLFRITAIAAHEIGGTETSRAKPYRGAVRMATRRLPDRMVE